MVLGKTRLGASPHLPVGTVINIKNRPKTLKAKINLPLQEQAKQKSKSYAEIRNFRGPNWPGRAHVLLYNCAGWALRVIHGVQTGLPLNPHCFITQCLKQIGFESHMAAGTTNGSWKKNCMVAQKTRHGL